MLFEGEPIRETSLCQKTLTELTVTQATSSFSTQVAQRRQQAPIIKVCFAWQVLFGIFLGILVWG